MKKENEWWKALAGLAVLAVVAAGLGLLFRGQRQTPVATEPTATVTTTCTPTPTTTPVSAATPTGAPGPRHLSAAVEVPVPQGFRLMDLCGDTVVGSLRVNDEPQIVLLNLTTGAMKQISSATGTEAKYSAHLSDSWIVWLEASESEDRLNTYNRETESECALAAEYPIRLGLSGDVVVWQEYGGDIFAQDLRTGQRWAIAGRGFQRYPYISGQWVIYLDGAKHSSKEQVADLRVYDLASGKDRVLGQVFHPLMGSAGIYHALSGSRVVWTTPMGADYTFQVLSLDLDNPQDQPSVVMSPGDFAPGSLRLFDDILVYHRGWGRTLYDLQRREQLAVLEQADTVIISDNRAVWEETLPAQDGSEKWSYRLYIATIEQ